MKSLLSSLATLFLFFNLNAQERPSPILFIYDASGSMWGQMEDKTKKEIASDVLGVAVGRLPDNQNIGLIAYGHRKQGDCDDIEYMVSLSNSSKGAITNAVNSLNPTGKTPLARSAILAINSLKETNTKATIILITDGIESCDGDLCQVVTNAKADGIDFKLNIVGFGLKQAEKEQLICAANEGNGKYYDADDSAGLGDVLTEATIATIDKPNGNFSVFAVKNGEPVDAWVKPQNSITGLELNGARTYRDTAFVYLPSGKYDIEIRPLENSDIPGTTVSVEMKEGETRHQDINFDGGTLEVSTTNNGEPLDGIVKMFDEKTGKVVANTRTYGRSQKMEVPAGLYKITYSAIGIEGTATNAEVIGVKVIANSTGSISHDFKSGIALIGVETTSGELIDSTVNFHEISTGKNVAGRRTYTSESSNPRKFILTPGEYEVKIVTLGNHKGKSDSFSLKIEEGKTVEKIISF